jgi:nucleotide-binding universal stress UspA family protein
MVARPSKAKIILLHVIDSFPYSVTDTLNIVEHRRTLETIARSLLDQLSRRCSAKGVSVETRLLWGTPYREILSCSQREKADLIVMGTHGRTGLEHLLLGSVAEKTVRLSSCPVLTVRSSPGKRRTAPR